MSRDRLYLLDAEWPDPALGADRLFYCKDCVTVEGLLHLFPERAANIDVIRLPWPRPRAALVETLGAEHQDCPVLVLAEGGFVNEIEALLAALHHRHGFPERHP